MTALVPPDLIPNWIPGEKTADSSHLDWSGLTLKGYPRNSVFRFRNRSASILPSKQDASPRRGRN